MYNAKLYDEQSEKEKDKETRCNCVGERSYFNKKDKECCHIFNNASYIPTDNIFY